jgi:eukaryotic-like serine/threonine-protein kinase
MRLLACLLALLVCQLVSLANDSTSFRGNPDHPSVYYAKPIRTTPQIKWKFATKSQVVSSPAVANGVLYVGSADHRLYALDSNTGAKKWEFKTGSGVASSPAISDGTVYFSSYDGVLYAVAADDGKLRWKFEMAGERRYAGTHLNGSQPKGESMPDPFDTYLSSPLVWKGAVYLGSGDGNIYSLDAATGKLNWKFKTGDVVHASPVISSGTLFIGSWDSYFYALDAATGKERWRFKTGEDPDIHNQVGIQSSAVVADGIVYFGCRDSNLYAVNAESGKKVWAYNNKGSWVIASPLVKDGKLYFETSDSGMFHTVDAKTGVEIFSMKFSGWPTFSSPILAGDVLYLGSLSGRLFAIDLNERKTLWEFQTDGNRQNGAVYTKADGTPNYEAAFLGDFYDDMVVGVQKMRSVGAIYSSPVLVDGVLYFGSTDGNIYALQ